MAVPVSKQCTARLRNVVENCLVKDGGGPLREALEIREGTSISEQLTVSIGSGSTGSVLVSSGTIFDYTVMLKLVEGYLAGCEDFSIGFGCPMTHKLHICDSY